ncbi:MAG: hypothetical protein RL497_2499 [Pseudomonadota bacterium]|jgi:RNA polymerase sigma-70 factor (ECF subfamily)
MPEANPFLLLFQTHYADIRALIAAKFHRAPQEAEDIVQDAFHNILRANNIDQLKNPKAYLYKTANNLALNRLRQQRQEPSMISLDEVKDSETADVISPERRVFAQQNLVRLEAALNQLPEKYRRTFLLSRIQEKTYREISEQLNITESTVEKHIIKVLKCLREHLPEVCE